MGFQITSFKDEIELNSKINRGLFSNDAISVSFYSYDKDSRMVVHQNEDEIHNTLAFIILEGSIYLNIEDKKIKLNQFDLFTVNDIYMFELYSAINCKFLVVTVGAIKVNVDNLEMRQKLAELKEKDLYTTNHNVRVGEYATQIIHIINPNYHDINLNVAATYHDIGKINVPLEILNKPGKYTTSEFDIMKKHPTDSYNMLHNSLPEKAAKIALEHHERLDGSGYPNHLKDNQICLEAKVLAVADVFDALTTTRSYRSAYTVEESLKIMKEEVEMNKLDKACFNALELLVKNKAIIIE